MTKARKYLGDTLSYGEKALAGPISQSAYQHIQPLLPAGASDVRVVQHVASIGAFMAAGVPLVIAARITNALSVEFNGGAAPSGLKEVAEKVAKPEELATLPTEPNDYFYHQVILRAEEREIREIHASARKLPIEAVPAVNYWEHLELQKRNGHYDAGLVPSRDSDIRIEICDRRHVFMWPSSRLKIFGENPEWEARKRAAPPERRLPERPGFVGWIEGWALRDADMRFRHVAEEIEMGPDEEPHRSRRERLIADVGEAKVLEWEPGWQDAARANAARLQAQAVQEVFPHATGRMTVNLSLGIRRAFDRIAAHRANKKRKAVTP